MPIESATGWRATGNLVAFQLGEIVVGVQVMQWAVFAEAFVEVAALDSVDEWSAVGGVVHFAVGVECDAVAVGAAFAEQFELVCDRMIPPQALLEFDAADAAGGGDAVDARTASRRGPGDGSDMVCVFHARSRKQHFWIAIWFVVAVGIGIEEQVGRIEDVHAAVAELDAGDDVQSVDEILSRVGGRRRWCLRGL